jgi:hypothetical protein
MCLELPSVVGQDWLLSRTSHSSRGTSQRSAGLWSHSQALDVALDTLWLHPDVAALGCMPGLPTAAPAAATTGVSECLWQLAARPWWLVLHPGLPGDPPCWQQAATALEAGTHPPGQACVVCCSGRRLVIVRRSLPGLPPSAAANNTHSHTRSVSCSWVERLQCNTRPAACNRVQQRPRVCMGSTCCLYDTKSALPGGQCPRRQWSGVEHCSG